MSSRMQKNMDKNYAVQRFSGLSPIALAIMGLASAANALAAVRGNILQEQTSASERSSFNKTAVIDFSAVASLIQALVREGVSPEEAALQVQFALQSSNPMVALSALVNAPSKSASTAPSTVSPSLDTLVTTLAEQMNLMFSSGQGLDLVSLLESVPESAGFSPNDLTQALETYKALHMSDGVVSRGASLEVAQDQIDTLLAQATQAGAVASDASAASAASSAGTAGAASAVGALSAAQAIALVGFAAVFAGAGLSDSDEALAPEASSSGNVLKGPIKGATVFRDLDFDYFQDSDEISVLTDARGFYEKLPGSGGQIVAQGGTDTKTEEEFNGLLAAPSSATVVTPLTTLLAAAPTLTATQLKNALGLTTDPLSFNPYGPTVNEQDAVKAEAAAAQVNTVLTSFGANLGRTLSESTKAVAFNLSSQIKSASGPLNLADLDLLNKLAVDLAGTFGLSAAYFSSAIEKSKDYNDQIAFLVKNGGKLDDIGRLLKDFQGREPKADPRFLPDITVAEDAPLLGSNDSGAFTLPSIFTATNIDRANLLKFFDNDSRTTGAAPTLTFDMSGYRVIDSGVSTADLVLSLKKEAFDGREMTLTLNDVKLDAVTSMDKTAFTLPAQTMSATLRLGNIEVGSFNLSNLDSDQLVLNAGDNTIGDSPAFTLKLDSLFNKISDNTVDVLDLAALDRTQIVALGAGLLAGLFDDITPAAVVATLRDLITLPESVNTVGEAVTLLKTVIDFPELSSLKVYDLMNDISAGATKNLLIAAAGLAGIKMDKTDSDTLSSALTKIGDKFGKESLSDVSNLLSNDLGLDQGISLVTVTADLVVVALGRVEGISNTVLLDKLVGAVVDSNNGDLRALLRGIDYREVVGDDFDVSGALDQLVEEGTVSYSDLVYLGARSLLSTDSDLVVRLTDLKGLSVSYGDIDQKELQVAVPIGSKSRYVFNKNGLVIPENAFTDPDGDKLTYTASLADGEPLPSWLRFDRLTKTFSGTPQDADVGVLDIKVIATDLAGNKASDVFKLTVTNTNDAPELVEGANTTIKAVEFADVSFDVFSAFKDIDAGDVLTFRTAAGTTLPTGLTLTPQGVLGGKAPVNSTNSNATQTIKITATDKAGATVTQDFTLTVTNDTTAPVKPTIALERDNGAASNDGLTSNGTIKVNGLETGSTWEYSTNNGSTWALGSGTSFVVPVGTYATQNVQVRQTDQAGNVSEVTKYTGALDIRTAPLTPTVSLANPDSGTAGDGVTNSGVVNVGQLLSSSGASWEYSIDSGLNWTTRTGSSFTLQDGVYAANQVQVRQSDGNFESFPGKIAAAVTIDSAKPVLTAAAPAVNTTTGVFTYTFTSNEALTGFDLSDITVTGGVKGNALTTSDNKTFTLEVRPATSSAATAPAADMSVAVAATAATDAAGNSLSAAVSVANSILFGTSANQTITGTDSADTIFGGGGNDTINAGDGNDVIKGGSGNDVISGGAGADKIDLSSGGTDVLKFAAATDSPVSGSDSVEGFAAGDSIDLSQILGANGIGYTGVNTIHTGSAESLFALKNPVMSSSGKVATVDIYYVGATRYNVSGTELKFMNIGADTYASSNVSSYLVKDASGSTEEDWQDAVGEIKAVMVNASRNGLTFQTDTKIATLEVTLKTAQSTYVFAVLGTQINGATTSGGTDTILIQDLTDQLTTNDVVPKTVVAGGTSFSVAGKYTIVDDGTTLGTVGDNEIHFANNPTTKTVDIRYDTNKAAGTTTASDIIHLDGITGIDLSKTDFVFV